MAQASTFSRWFDAVVLDLGRQVRWSFLPPLMIYFAFGFTGLSGVTGGVGAEG